MSMSRNELLKAVVQLRKKNEELQDLIGVIQSENFEYALKCNRMENILANVKLINQDNPRKLIEATEHLPSILQTSSAQRPVSVTMPLDVQNNISGKSLVKSTQGISSPKSNKAHVVTPHTVNGTILYTPRIKLIRVTDTQNQSGSFNLNNNQFENSHLESNKEEVTSTNCSGHEADSSSVIETTDCPNHNETQLEDISQVSTSNSSAHSTVLSGTFQEVKIYLNPISPDQINSDSVRSAKIRRRSPKHRYRYLP